MDKVRWNQGHREVNAFVGFFFPVKKTKIIHLFYDPLVAVLLLEIALSFSWTHSLETSVFSQAYPWYEDRDFKKNLDWFGACKECLLGELNKDMLSTFRIREAVLGTKGKISRKA